jgi:hypothetical protein
MHGLRKWRLWPVVVAVLILTMGHGTAWAQVTAAITGRVEDPSGAAAVSGATVTVKSVETGARRIVTTDDAGNFRVLSLPVGPQEVIAEKTGFKASVRNLINLKVGQEAVVVLQLRMGEVVQEVTVSDKAPLVNATTASVSGMVGEREVKDLPLNGRSFDNLITLNPGAVNYSAMRSAHTTTSNGNAFSVAGRRPVENLFLLNGIEYTGTSQLAVTPGGASGNLLGIDAVREFNLLADAYGAEYGKRAGAQVSIVTQSGSNALHGSAFEFIRNSALDARNFFDQGSVPPFRQNQFGGALGGPLKRNRLFLFGNYEGFRQRLALSSVSVVPDDQARRGILAASPACTALHPCTAMLPYMALWPQPNGAKLGSGTALAFSNPSQSVREDFGTLRTDYIIGDRDSLSGAYTVDDGGSLIPLADPLFGSSVALRSQVVSLQETHIFSPRLLNTFTAGFSRAGFGYDSFPLIAFPPSLSFVAGTGPGGIVIGGGVTTTGSGSLTAAGPNNAAGVSNHRNLFTFSDSLQISKGIHQISVGVSFQRLQDNEDSASRRLGQASFDTLSSFLQGQVKTFQAVLNPTELGWRSWFGAWYFQDTIKVRSNLALQFGLRHEFTTGWNEAGGRASNFLTGANGVLLTAPQVGDSAFTQNNAKRLFGPRVGLAWDVFGTGKTAVRAGFGTHYSLLDALSFMLNSNPPYNGAVSCASKSIGFFNFPISVLPSCPIAPQGVQANAKTPTVNEWNLTLEQQLNRNTVLSVAYVGSFGYHGLLSTDPNTIPAQICSNPAGCVSGGFPGTTTGFVPQGARYIPVGTRPNPSLSSAFFWFSEGNSSYNALQVDVTRRMTRSLQFRANYTWSKNLDMNSGLTGAQATNQAQMILDRNDLRTDWGPSALNVAHQAHISGTFELPFGHGQPWLAGTTGVAGKLVGGWQLNGIATFMSGFPFTPQVGSNRSGDGDTRNPDRPSLNPSFAGSILPQTPGQWFNPNAFMLPTPGTYGNLGRGTLTGPGMTEVDLSLFKNTSVSERINLQFRAEIFNVLNHTNLGTPNPIVFSGGATSPSAGLITATATASRQIQFGLKLMF